MDKNRGDKELFFEKLVWMTTAEAAEYLRRSVGAVRIMVHRRQLPARKLGRRIYFNKMELDRLLETSFY